MKPVFCTIARCHCVVCHQRENAEQDQGGSVFCVGWMAEPEVWVAGRTEHRNDLNICIFSPFKGWVRLVANDADVRILQTMLERLQAKRTPCAEKTW